MRSAVSEKIVLICWAMILGFVVCKPVCKVNFSCFYLVNQCEWLIVERLKGRRVIAAKDLVVLI